MFGFFDECKRYDTRQSINQVVTLGMVLSVAFMIWKGLGIYANCESPIVVVLSGSMEPICYRGDLLFVDYDPNRPVHVGDIIVFKINKKEIPIVHRVVAIHDTGRTRKYKVLTKGDNNQGNDRGLYNDGDMWVLPHQITGRIRGNIPYMGMATILMSDNPSLKYALLAILGLFVIVERE